MAVDVTDGRAGTRERILEAAESLFAERGFDSVSLRDITGAAGANVAAVNYHFGSKDNLIDAVIERHATPINQARIAHLDAAESRHSRGVPVEEILQAFLAGELDPGFKGLSVWDYRMVVDGNEPDYVLAWGREMLRNYRPDHMKLDYKWRYCRITKTDVPYTSNATGAREAGRQKYNLSSMQSYFLVGGICGPRAFTGRAATHAYGIPSRPAPQTGHAAIAFRCLSATP